MTESKRVFSGPTYDSFKEAFPEVEEINFSYSIHHGVGSTRDPYKMDQENFTGVIRCPNKYCVEGGFEIDTELLLNVFHPKLTHREGWIPCSGYQPLGRWNKRRCNYMIEYEVDVKYK